jgi:hypothetical protein
MTKYLFSRRSRSWGLGGMLAVLFAGLAASPALADTTAPDTSMCSAQQFSQPFLTYGDSNYYTLAPGESADNFDGGGWTLTGGAQIETATLADGTTGSVLDLPSGSQAVSPTVCVASDYPDARMMVANASGSNGGKVSFSVSYAGTSSANSPVQTGTFKTTGSKGVAGDFELSDPVALEPSSSAGWQPMQITLTAAGPKEYQVYNLDLDPRMHW